MGNKRKKNTDQSVEGLASDISQIVQAFQDVHKRARALGIFTHDRELLECHKCGLTEDVACDGRLLTFQKIDASYSDTGLRFEEMNPTHFRCPQCKTVIELLEGDKS
ncbi:MAG: hypothetical protein WC956_08530 [bacterium]